MKFTGYRGREIYHAVIQPVLIRRKARVPPRQPQCQAKVWLCIGEPPPFFRQNSRKLHRLLPYANPQEKPLPAPAKNPEIHRIFPGIPCLAGSGFDPQSYTLPLTGPLHTKSSRMEEKMSSRIPSSRQVQPWGTPFSFKRVSPARTVRVSPSMVKENAPETT